MFTPNTEFKMDVITNNKLATSIFKRTYLLHIVSFNSKSQVGVINFYFKDFNYGGSLRKEETLLSNARVKFNNDDSINNSISKLALIFKESDTKNEAIEKIKVILLELKDKKEEVIDLTHY